MSLRNSIHQNNPNLHSCSFEALDAAISIVPKLMHPAPDTCAVHSCRLPGGAVAPVVAAHKLCKADGRWHGPPQRIAQAARHLVGIRARLAHGQHPVLRAVHTPVSQQAVQARYQQHSTCRGWASGSSSAKPLGASTCVTQQAGHAAGLQTHCLTRSSARVTAARPGDVAMELNRACACCTIATFFA